jgi:hypothetical protein
MTTSGSRRGLAPPPLLLLPLLLASSPRTARATLVLAPTPPAGFNSFMRYQPGDLNSTSLPALAATFAAGPLAAAGFTDFVVDGGWASSPNGSAWVQNLDAWGRPVAAPERFPDGLKGIAAGVRALGLKFGLWHIRGIHVSAAARRLPVKGMEQYTLDELVDSQKTGGGNNGSCLWAPEWLGVNASHPAAQAYYDSIVEQLVENLGADIIKGDCFFCRPCYSSEMELLANAVRARPEPITLYLSPGGGALVEDGAWAAANEVATFYRTITDFDEGDWYDWGGLQQAIFIAGNFTQAALHGANSTWPDLDMLPLDANWWAQGDPVERRDRGQTIATLWAIGRYPLTSAGLQPLDALTLSYLTNARALALNRRAEVVPTTVSYAGNCTCTGGDGSCTIPHGPGDHPAEPCVATWVAAVGAPGAWTAFALLNMGEDPAATATGFAALGLPATSANVYRVEDLWTGEALGDYFGDEEIQVALRPHASALLVVTRLA